MLFNIDLLWCDKLLYLFSFIFPHVKICLSKICHIEMLFNMHDIRWYTISDYNSDSNNGYGLLIFDYKLRHILGQISKWNYMIITSNMKFVILLILTILDCWYRDKDTNVMIIKSYVFKRVIGFVLCETVILFMVLKNNFCDLHYLIFSWGLAFLYRYYDMILVFIFSF